MGTRNNFRIVGFSQILIIVFIVFLSGRHILILNSYCQNLELVIASIGKFSKGNAQNFCSSLPGSNSQYFWLRGRNLWLNDDLAAAENMWRNASEYSAKMLIHNVQQEGELEPYTDIIRVALLLDPYSQENAGEATLWLISRGDWLVNYQILSEVLQMYPDSAIVNSALALTATIFNESDLETIQLFDKAFQTEPENRYVILYGFRLMMQDQQFDKERIKKLIRAAEQLLPEDFTFTFNLANAYRKLEDYSKANFYNVQALEMNPDHAVANLQQIELSLLLDQRPVDYDKWLEVAIRKRVKNTSYYKRLIIVLFKLNKNEEASLIYCEGLSYGFSASVLTPSFSNNGYFFTSCSK